MTFSSKYEWAAAHHRLPIVHKMQGKTPQFRIRRASLAITLQAMLIGLILFGLLCSPPSATAATPPPDAADGSHLNLRISPFIDMHQHVRAVAAGDVESLAIERIDSAVAAAREIDTLVWGLLEGNILAAADAASLVAVCEQLPISIQREGREIFIREAAVAYARGLHSIESAFLADHWAPRLTQLRAASESLERTLLSKERACFEHLMQSYAIQDPAIAIPIHLVIDAPSPGGVTYRTRSGSECVVAVSGLSPSLLAEIVLHEASHALDVATMRQPTALMQLRHTLQAAGVDSTDPRHRDIWHTIMFIQSAETIRRIVDPSHLDYGEHAGYYTRVRNIADVQRPIWKSYLNEQITLQDALDAIVRELTQPPTQQQ